MALHAVALHCYRWERGGAGTKYEAFPPGLHARQRSETAAAPQRQRSDSAARRSVTLRVLDDGRSVDLEASATSGRSTMLPST